MAHLTVQDTVIFNRDLLSFDYIEQYGSAIIDIVYMISSFSDNKESGKLEAALCNAEPRPPFNTNTITVPVTLANIPVELLVPFNVDDFNLDEHVKPYIELIPKEFRIEYA